MRVAVIGGGVVGLACAFELVRRGAHVVVLERGRVGGGASAGNTGWVTPSLASPLPSPGARSNSARAVLRSTGPLAVRTSLDPGYLRWLWRFRRNCTHERWLEGARALVRLNRRTLELLRDYETSGIAFESYGAGLLVVALGPEKLGEYAQLLGDLRALGHAGDHSVLAGDEARDVEPSLSPQVSGGVLTEVDRWVRPETLTAGLAERLRADGAEIRENVEVTAISGHSVETSAGPVTCDRAVVAAGIASPPLLARLGVRVTLAPGRGYSATFASSSAPTLRHALYLADARLGLSGYDGAVRLAGVFELGYDSVEIRDTRFEAMLASADPFFADWRPSETPADTRWAGLRPLTSDGLPLIGASPADPHVFVATGHGMLGVTLAPATAALLAELVVEGESDPALVPFSPSRAA